MRPAFWFSEHCPPAAEFTSLSSDFFRLRQRLHKTSLREFYQIAFRKKRVGDGRAGGQPTLRGAACLCNRRGDKLNVLYYDGQGLCLWCKRLERGRFRIPTTEPADYAMPLPFHFTERFTL